MSVFEINKLAYYLAYKAMVWYPIQGHLDFAKLFSDDYIRPYDLLFSKKDQNVDYDPFIKPWPYIQSKVIR